MINVLLTLLVGVICGVIDIIPMIKMKLDRFSIISAFVFYLIAPFIVYSTDLFGMPWWLKGGVVTLLMAIPIVILVAKDGMKNALPIVALSVILGSLIGIVGEFVILQ